MFNRSLRRAFLAFSLFSYSSSILLCRATRCWMMHSSAAVNARLSRSLKMLSHLGSVALNSWDEPRHQVQAHVQVTTTPTVLLAGDP